MSQIPTTRLGKTGLEVSRLGMGGLFLASFAGNFAQAQAAVEHAVACGVTLIDTAPGYHDSEEIIGKILPEIVAPLMVSTKLGGRPQPFEPQNRDHLLRSIEESLRLLGRSHLDFLLIHEPERPRQYSWWSEGFYEGTLKGTVLEVLDELKRDGTIRFAGIGGTTAYEMVRLCDTGLFDIVLTAFNYSLLWREAESTVLPAAERNGMGVLLGSPLQQGALARRYDQEITSGAPWLSPPRRAQYQALYALLDQWNLPIAEAAMRFPLSHPAIHCILTGARSVDEVESNVAAVAKGTLPTEFLTQLDAVAATVPFRPFCEPFCFPFGGKYAGPGPA